jgi:hypothetical protein
MKPMMMCGHAANGSGANGPICVICAGTDPGATMIDTRPLNLDGREARCHYVRAGKYGASSGEARADRHGYAASSTDLPFFESKPNQEFDEYYCGCWGWD